MDHPGNRYANPIFAAQFWEQIMHAAGRQLEVQYPSASTMYLLRWVFASEGNARLVSLRKYHGNMTFP
jgi:hypothetical protein